MLILTRKRDDSIRIGEDIIVRVMRTNRGSVKIGIEAPESVRIMRGELHDPDDALHGAVAEPTHDDCDVDALLLQH